MYPKCSCVWILNLYLIILFGKMIELLESLTFPKEAYPWENLESFIT